MGFREYHHQTEVHQVDKVIHANYNLAAIHPGNLDYCIPGSEENSYKEIVVSLLTRDSLYLVFLLDTSLRAPKCPKHNSFVGTLKGPCRVQLDEMLDTLYPGSVFYPCHKEGGRELQNYRVSLITNLQLCLCQLKVHVHVEEALGYIPGRLQPYFLFQRVLILGKDEFIIHTHTIALVSVVVVQGIHGCRL